MLAKLRDGVGDEGAADAVLWELATVEQALRQQGTDCDVVERQLSELRSELERRSARLEGRLAELVATTDAEMIRLDALASALRHPLDQVEAFVQARWQMLSSPSSP